MSRVILLEPPFTKVKGGCFSSLSCSHNIAQVLQVRPKPNLSEDGQEKDSSTHTNPHTKTDQTKILINTAQGLIHGLITSGMNDCPALGTGFVPERSARR